MKPRLRGRIHQVAFFAAIPACAVLVAVARRASVRTATAVYAASLIGLLGTSAAYHRGRWSPRALRRMRKLDHSMIFVLIAGTYTPFAVVALHGVFRVGLLVTAWTVAAVGVTLKLLRIDGLQKLGGTLYISLGWLFVVAAPQVVRTVPPVPLMLTVLGGLAYTAGAVVLARRRPDPNPRVFGYHEVWHSFVVAGNVSHFAALLMLVTTVR